MMPTEPKGEKRPADINARRRHDCAYCFSKGS
jgi:hypothetical protein